MKAFQTKPIHRLVVSVLAVWSAASYVHADDHSETLDLATPISAPDTAGSLDSEEDYDWFQFEVTVPGRHWIYTTGPTTDTRGNLYDSVGNQISGVGGTNDDDAGDGRNFFFTVILQPGTYHIRVEDGTQGETTGDYTLSIRSPENATPFNSSHVAAGLDIPGDIDLYRIDITESGRVWAYTTGATDTFATLYDSTGNSIIGGANEDDAGGNGRNFQFSLKVTPGTYYLRIKDGTQGNRTGDYTLNWLNQENARMFAESDLGGSLGVLGELDLYRIDLSKAGPFWLWSTGTTDTYARLYDSAGNLNLSGGNADNAGAGRNFSISEIRQPGTYYLLVESGGADSGGDYSLHLRDASRAVPLFGDRVSSHEIDTFGDLDVFVFSTVGGEVTFSTSGMLDTYGALYESSGQVVVSGGNANNAGPGDNFLMSPTLLPGEYFLLVRGAQLDLVSGGYELEATFEPGDLTRLSGAAAVVSDDSSSIEVRSSTSWMVTDLPSWVSASTAGGTGDGMVTLNYAPNLSGEPRQATIMIGGQAYSITQRIFGDPAGQPVPAEMTITQGVVITVPTLPGMSYRVETSGDMVNWMDTGVVLVGDGRPQTVAFARGEGRSFFRAVPK